MSTMMSANALSIEQNLVMSPKSPTSSTKPEHSVISTSKDASHSTPNVTTSSSRNQGTLTSHAGNSSKSVSVLDLWAYENRKEELTYAERLEKQNWEVENSRL